MSQPKSIHFFLPFTASSPGHLVQHILPPSVSPWGPPSTAPTSHPLFHPPKENQLCGASAQVMEMIFHPCLCKYPLCIVYFIAGATQEGTGMQSNCQIALSVFISVGGKRELLQLASDADRLQAPEAAIPGEAKEANHRLEARLVLGYHCFPHPRF